MLWNGERLQGGFQRKRERQSDQPELFYGFSLERHVPSDHLLRSIDQFVDLGDIRAQLRPFYSDMGRPSIDPELTRRNPREGRQPLATCIFSGAG